VHGADEGTAATADHAHAEFTIEFHRWGGVVYNNRG
jgi:hypothetical protein